MIKEMNRPAALVKTNKWSIRTVLDPDDDNAAAFGCRSDRVHGEGDDRRRPRHGHRRRRLGEGEGHSAAPHRQALSGAGSAARV